MYAALCISPRIQSFIPVYRNLGKEKFNFVFSNLPPPPLLLPPSFLSCAGIFKQSMGARNQVGIGLSYWPARARIFYMFMEPRNWLQGMNSASLFRLAGRYNNPFLPRFLAPIDFLKIPAQATQPDGINSLESILGLLESFKIRALVPCSNVFLVTSIQCSPGLFTSWIWPNDWRLAIIHLSA